MHLNAFGGRAPPGPAGGVYSAPADPYSWIKGEEKEKGKVGKGRGNGEGRGKGEEKKERGPPPQCLKCVDAHVFIACFQTWPWVGLTHGLSWVGSSSVKYDLMPNSTGKY